MKYGPQMKLVLYLYCTYVHSSINVLISPHFLTNQTKKKGLGLGELRADSKWPSGRIWPPGRSLDNPDVV